MSRKKMVAGFRKLRYLDDRPVSEIERIAADAWKEGGPELEGQKRREYQEADMARKRSYYLRNNEIEEEYRKYKAEKIANMKKDTKEKQDKLVDKKEKLREMIRKARPQTAEQRKYQSQLEHVNSELKSDMFEILTSNNIVVPPMRRVSENRTHPMELVRRGERRMAEQEEEAKERERQEYLERERPDLPKAPGLIPTPVASQPRVKTKAERMRDEGVVMSTDSESENDPTLPAKRAGYRREIFKWDEFYENKLEELLIQHMFDFTKAAQDFSAMVNNFEDDSPENRFYYEINPKILQMKWTDVEIKKFRIVEFTKDKEDKSSSDDEDLPSLDEFEDDDPVRTYTQDASKEERKETQESVVPSKKEPPVNPLHQFSSSSEDEEDDDLGGTNFEELD